MTKARITHCESRFELGALLLLAASFATACSDSAAEDPARTPSETALLVSLRVHTIDGRFIYMGAFPEVPTSEPSRDRMVELAGFWQVTAFDGSAYAWEQETGQMTRWTVSDDLDMEKGATMSLANLGLDGWRYHAYVAPDRAYTLGLENGVVAIWDPKRMEIVDEIHFDVPPDFEGMDAYPLSVIVRDNLVFAPMYGENYETGEIVPRQVVGVIDTDTDEVSFITDDRCLPSGIGHVNESGDIYLDPYQGGTYNWIYSPQEGLPPPCTLRIRSGQDVFDRDYVLDYSEVVGRHADGVWPIEGDLVMALSVAPTSEIPPPEAQDDYWTLPQVASAVDVVTGDAEPYAGLPEDLQMQNAIQHVADGVSYYQNYQYDADDNIEVVEVGALTPTGWQKQFEIHGGDLWGILRVR